MLEWLEVRLDVGLIIILFLGPAPAQSREHEN